MKVLNIQDIAFDPETMVNIMRPGKFGNIFRIGVHGTRDQVVDRHMKYLRNRIGGDLNFRSDVKHLIGRDLVCCCSPQRCHGDNLILVCEELNK